MTQMNRITSLAASVALSISSTSTIAGAPRTAFDELNRLDPDTRYINPIWRGDTAVVRFETYESINADREPVGPILDAGWYLVDVDRKGIIDWWTNTRQDPKGRYAMEIAQGADMATTILGVTGAMGPVLDEVNPLGVPGVGVAKVIITQTLRRSRGKTCYSNVGGITAVGWGAAAANIFAPAGPIGLLAFIPGAIAGIPNKNSRFWMCAPKPGQSSIVFPDPDPVEPGKAFDYLYGLGE